MRSLGKQLGVEAMSLYNHVANKEDIIDGLVAFVFGEIHVPEAGDWKAQMRLRAISTREALNRHRWAVGLMEGRLNPGPATMRKHNAAMGCLREAGFSFRDAVHAYSVQDAYIYGFALQERGLGFETPEESAQVDRTERANVPEMDSYPYLVETAQGDSRSAGYDYEPSSSSGWT